MRKTSLFFIIICVLLGLSGAVSVKASALDELKRSIGYMHDYGDICRCIEAEATDGTYDQKLNVGSCVMNRVDSKGWPNDIHSVIFQKRQFAVISDGRFWKVNPCNKDTLLAALRVIFGERTHRCEFFCTPAASRNSSFFKKKEYDYVFNDGMHDYYR